MASVLTIYFLNSISIKYLCMTSRNEILCQSLKRSFFSGINTQS